MPDTKTGIAFGNILVDVQVFHHDHKYRGNNCKDCSINNILPADKKPGNSQKGDIDSKGNVTDVDAKQLLQHHGNAVDAAGGKACGVYKAVQSHSRQRCRYHNQKHICYV